MWVAAVGLRAAACLGVVGATDGCAARAMGAYCTASEVNGVVTGCPATSTLGCVSDSIWVTFTNVISCSSVLSSDNDFNNVGAMICCTY